VQATAASAQKLLEEDPSKIFLQTRLNNAEQELKEKEIRKAEWSAIRASAKWAQIDGRMPKEFFKGVTVAQTRAPISLLRNDQGMELTTNKDMSEYANSFYQKLFQIQGKSEACIQACNHYWDRVPNRVINEQNE
jgi:hypothetical protein